MHAWPAGRGREFAELAVRAGHAVRESPWTGAIKGVGAEIDSLGQLLRGPGDAYTGLVHGDACPDNTQLSGGDCRFIDFETAGWGPFAFDAAYLLAPFPSCWCFAALTAEVAGRALENDPEWGTTTARPRALTWLRSFAAAAARSAVLPRLRTLAEALDEQLSARWPETVVPGYPALARPGAPLARPPGDWETAG